MPEKLISPIPIPLHILSIYIPSSIFNLAVGLPLKTSKDHTHAQQNQEREREKGYFCANLIYLITKNYIYT